MRKIREVSGTDYSSVALTQEILIYLAMFIRSEPELFQVPSVDMYVTLTAIVCVYE